MPTRRGDPVIDEIRSDDDPRLAPYARVGDAGWLRQQGLFVAEGRLVVERLIDAGRFGIDSIVLTPAARDALAARLEALETNVWVCSPDVLNRVTGFNFHRGCLALARRPSPAPIESWLARAGIVLGLEAIGNPDNVGGLFRTAAAFGATGIIVSPSTADPLYRKSVRTSMGAVLQVPWRVDERWPAGLATLRTHGYRIAALTPHEGAIPIGRFPPPLDRRVVLLLGAEGPGLSPETLALADTHVRIPIVPGVDSLNVAVAAGIALHALSPLNFEPEP